MKTPAAWASGYQQVDGQLQIRDGALVFGQRKHNQAGTFAAFGLLGLALSDPFEDRVAIPLADCLKVEASPYNAHELMVHTPRGPFVFLSPMRDAWIDALWRSVPASRPT